MNCVDLDVEILNIISIVKTLIKILEIGAIVALIIWAMVDIIKLITQGDVDINKALKKISKRLIAMAIIFLVPLIVNTVLGMVDSNSYINYYNCANAEQVRNTYIAQATEAMNDFIQEPNHKNYLKAYELVNKVKKEDLREKDNYLKILNDYKKSLNDDDDSNNGGIIIDNPTIDDKNITFSYEYREDLAMPYGIFKPSSASSSRKTPLIIFLHGSLQTGTTKTGFENTIGPNVFSNWPLYGFNAYVLCPHYRAANYGGYNSGWRITEKDFFELLDQVIKKYNIDTNRIYLSGASLGGSGAEYLGAKGINRFAAITVMSGYGPAISQSLITNYPFRGYVENSGRSMNYMVGAYTSNQIRVLPVGHDGVPKTAFYEDANNDNKSDLIVWMLSQRKK